MENLVGLAEHQGIAISHDRPINRSTEMEK